MAKTTFSFPAFLRPQGAVVPARHFVDFILRLPSVEILKPIFDLLLISVAAAWAWAVSYGQVAKPGSPVPFFVAVFVARTLIYFALKLHRTSWLHVSRFEVMWLVVSALIGPPIIALLLWVLPDPFTLNKLTRPEIILSTEAAFYLLLLFGARITARALAHSKRPSNLRRILIIGAGQKGRSLAYQIQETGNNYQAVGFLDDEPAKQGRSFRGIKVLGGSGDLCDVAARIDIHEVVIAIASLEPQQLRQILVDGEKCAIPVRILPPLGELIGGRTDLRAVRAVRMEDLLPRPAVELDMAVISAYLTGRTVLVTGGGGSIGSELCRQALRAGAQRLLVLGRGENSVFEALQDLSDLKASGDFGASASCEIIPVICNIRDRDALKSIFERYQPEVVFHAAAHKHVPLMEQYPCEAVKNNVHGTLNVVDLACHMGVKRLVLVSTDKAVAPTSVMGATKRITEMIIQSHRARKDIDIVCVRFGNVLGSRGSVVPTMTRQIQRGLPVTVTDPEMVRFFMTIPEAVQLILQAGAVGGRGEVFVLDMGRPVKILDLAHDLIRLHGLVPNQDIPIHIIGKRPGEKMYEELLTVNESVSAEKRGPFFVAATQPFDREEFSRQVRLLIHTASEGNDEGVRHMLCQIVPEFCTSASLPKPQLNLVEQVINQTMVAA